MSQQNTTHFPDAYGKITQEDKCGLYESSKIDSGFISGSNLMSESDSGIIEEPEHSRTSIHSHSIQEEDNSKEPEYMKVDSGVCLSISESFSNLSLKQDLNNLNSPKSKHQTPVDSFQKTDSNSIIDPVVKTSDDVPWELYYEQDEDGDTQLHAAIVEGFAEVALALIRAAPHPRLLDTPNDDAQTPLHLAVETAQWRIVRWLVVAGARPCPRGTHGDSPLHIAARNGDVNCIKAIADPVKQQEREALALGYHGHVYQPCSFDQWNYLGQTCVHLAAMHGHVEALRHLVWYGADINAREGCMGYTALHYAVERRDESLVQFMLQCKALNAETETYGGRNVLEMKLTLSPSMRQALRNTGVPSPYSSDSEEFDSEDSGDEMMYENSRMFTSVPMVNASA